MNQEVQTNNKLIYSKCDLCNELIKNIENKKKWMHDGFIQLQYLNLKFTVCSYCAMRVKNNEYFDELIKAYIEYHKILNNFQLYAPMKFSYNMDFFDNVSEVQCLDGKHWTYTTYEFKPEV